LYAGDQQWVVTETRAAAAVFHPEGVTPSEQSESFEVDGTTVWFTVA
jgi:hypothetical protein